MKTSGEQQVLPGLGEGTQLVLPNLEIPSVSVENYEPQPEKPKYLDPMSEEARLERVRQWEEDHSDDAVELQWWQK